MMPILSKMKDATFALAVVLLAIPITPIARAADTTLNVGAIPIDADANVFYALDKGFFKNQGLNVRITPMTSGPAVLAALVGGSVDVGVSNVLSLTTARSRGINIRFIAPSGISTPSTATDLLLVPSGSPVQSAADLNGKTVAVSALNTVQEVVASAWLDKHGGDSKTIKWLEVPFSEMAAALDTHRVDAALTTEPFSTVAEKSARSLGPVLQSIGPQFLLLGWCTTDTWLSANGQTVRKFAFAIKQASIWANGHQAESASILVKYTRIDPTLATKMKRITYGTELSPILISIPMEASLHYGILKQGVPVADTLWRPTP